MSQSEFGRSATAAPSAEPLSLPPGERILSLRLRRPRINNDLLPREHLLNRLDAGLRCGVTLVSAPPGFGKSSLVATWLRRQAWPAAWLSLEESEDNLTQFLGCLVAAIQSIFPASCQKAAQLRFSQQSLAPDLLADILLDDLLLIGEPFILVIDDYHIIHTQGIHDCMSRLLRHLPEPLHVVLIARSDPPLPLAWLRAASQLFEIRERDLRFRADECYSFLQQSVDRPIDDSSAQAIIEGTEGWPAGMRLVALSLQGMAQLSTDQPSMAQNRYIVDYLVAEVLANQPQDRLEFLLKTAILDQLCAGLCAAVLAAELAIPAVAGAAPAASHFDAAWVQRELEALERSNLFTIPLDLERRWYRYHHLFRDFLRHALRERYDNTVIASLHRQASRWYSANGFIEEAARHAVLAGDEVAAAQIIEAQIIDVFNQQEFSLVKQWLALLPSATVAERPLLLAVQAWLLHDGGEPTAAAQTLERIEALLASSTHGLEPAHEQLVRGEVAGLRAIHAALAEDHLRALQLADECLRLLTPRYPRTYTGVLDTKAEMMDALGRRAEVFPMLEAILTANQNSGGLLQVNPLLTWTALVLKAGDTLKVLELGKQLLRLAHNSQFPQAIAFTHANLGIAYFRRDELAAAEEHFRVILASHHIAHYLSRQDALAGLALCYQAYGQSEQARQMVAESMALERALYGPHTAIPGNSLWARLALLEGNWPQAVQWAQSFDLAAADTLPAGIELPRLTYARVLIASGLPEQLGLALTELTNLRRKAEAQQYIYHVVDILAVEALALDGLGRRRSALETLNQAAELAQPGQQLRIFRELGPAIVKLLPTGPEKLESAMRWLVKHCASPVVVVDATVPAVDSAELVESLTDRELEVLQLLALRLTDKEIAAKLQLSLPTVQRHNSNIYAKLQVNKRRDAVVKARLLGLFPTLTPNPE